MPLWKKVVLLAVGGALGALARVGLGSWVQARLSEHLPGGVRFPWGTLSVNLIGCFLFGLVWSLLELRYREAAQVRLLILGGFMGAFTTFSTFIFDIVHLGEARWQLAALNLAAQNVLGIVLLVAGAALGRLL